MNESQNLAKERVTEYLNNCYKNSNLGDSLAWVRFCQCFCAVGFDKDLRLISEAYNKTLMEDYLKDKSLQRKSQNALSNMECLYDILSKFIPPTPEFLSTLTIYLDDGAEYFLKRIGLDLTLFLSWLDYRSKNGDFVRRMKSKDLDAIREVINKKGDVYFVYILLRAIMAYKSIVTKTQIICDRLGLESGMAEKKRLEEKRRQKQQKALISQEANVKDKKDSFATIGDAIKTSQIKKSNKTKKRK